MLLILILKLISPIPENAKILNLLSCSWSCYYRQFKIISDGRIRFIISKGPGCRFSWYIGCNKSCLQIAKALQEFYKYLCKREYAGSYVLNEWKLSVFKQSISVFHFTLIIQIFYRENLNFLFDI